MNRPQNITRQLTNDMSSSSEDPQEDDQPVVVEIEDDSVDEIEDDSVEHISISSDSEVVDSEDEDSVPESEAYTKEDSIQHEPDASMPELDAYPKEDRSEPDTASDDSSTDLNLWCSQFNSEYETDDSDTEEVETPGQNQMTDSSELDDSGSETGEDREHELEPLCEPDDVVSSPRVAQARIASSPPPSELWPEHDACRLNENVPGLNSSKLEAFTGIKDASFETIPVKHSKPEAKGEPLMNCNKRPRIEEIWKRSTNSSRFIKVFQNPSSARFIRACVVRLIRKKSHVDAGESTEPMNLADEEDLA